MKLTQGREIVIISPDDGNVSRSTKAYSRCVQYVHVGL